MSEQPLVSVVVPCYNQGEFLSETLDSVLIQSFNSWECLIVDDGSTDNTRQVATDYCNLDKRFKYIFQRNAGPSVARNNGINNAAGQYILPLDADDIIDTFYVELAVSRFNDVPDTKLVYCKAKKFGHENGDWQLKPYTYQDLLEMNCLFCSAFYRKDDWAINGGYDETFLTAWEDWAFWVKLLDENSIVYQIPEFLFYYRIKTESRNTDIKKKDSESAKWEIFNNNIDSYKRNFDAPQSLIKKIRDLEQLNLQIKNSASYKLGHILLMPVSIIKRSIKKYL